MKFLEPRWLWGLLILPVFYLLMLWDEKRRRKQFARFADPKLWEFLAPELNLKLRIRKSFLSLAACAFALIAFARPQWGTHEETVKVSGLDVMLVLDISNSMSTEDVVPSRLQKMKHWVHSLLSTLEGDRVGVVAFAASTAVVCPLTSDLSYVWDTVQLLDPRVMRNQGTDVGLAIQTATHSIERGAEEVTAGGDAPLSSRVMILVSDGEDHQKQAFAEVDQLKKKGIRLFAFGIGTEKGGPIPLKDELGNIQGYKRDRRGEPVMSTFHPEFLSSLAKSAEGKYWSTTPEEKEILELSHELGLLTRGDYAERRFLIYEDRFQIPLLLAVALLFFELSTPVRRLLSFMGILFVFTGESAHAAPVRGPIPLESYLENRKGLQAYERGDWQEAQKSFGSAQARDPFRPELEFNQGVLKFRQGDVEGAIESFEKSAQGASQSREAGLLGKSLYNLGNAYSKKGQAKEAIRAFSDAIEVALANGDAKLEQAARKNLQLMIDPIKKQNQNQEDPPSSENQKGQQQKDGQDQKNQDSQKSGSSKQDPAQNQSQSKEASDPKKQKDDSSQSAQGEKKDEEKRLTDLKNPKNLKNQFRSQRMSREDADRVLSELKNRERELQEKLQSKNGNQQTQEKDW